MNLKEYISTGILELYVLGSLSKAEEKEVEEMLRQHLELEDELNRIQQVMEDMARAQAVEAPPHLKEKIRSQIHFGNTVAPPAPAMKLLRNYKLAAAACVTLAIISSAAAFYYHNKWQQTTSELALLNEKQTLLSNTVQRTQLETDQLQSEIKILKNPDFRVCTLKGVNSAPEARVMVYWNPEKKETLVAVKNLPAAPEGSQYQLWAMVDGKPVDAGVFETGSISDTLQRVKDISQAQAFAVTLEKKGGSPVPTLDKLIVIGNI